MKVAIYGRVGNKEQLNGGGKVTTICYGKKDVWNSRDEAIQFFLQAMVGSEGSEQDRYSTILVKLNMGMDICSDEE